MKPYFKFKLGQPINDDDPCVIKDDHPFDRQRVWAQCFLNIISSLT